MNQHQGDLQVEGSTECPQGTTRAQCQLLGHICTSSKLANTAVVFIHSIMKEWYSQQMDFILAYPHAPPEVPLYMNFPKGYKFKEGITTKIHVLKLIKNLYGQKQVGRVWNKYLHKRLSEIGFVPSKLEPCLYYKEKVTLLVYIDDCVMFSPTEKELRKVVNEMRN